MVHRGGFHIVGGKPHGGHVVGFGICPNSLENPNGALSRCLGQFACAKRNHFLQVSTAPRCVEGEENCKVATVRCVWRVARKRGLKIRIFESTYQN